MLVVSNMSPIIGEDVAMTCLSRTIASWSVVSQIEMPINSIVTSPFSMTISHVVPNNSEVYKCFGTTMEDLPFAASVTISVKS